MLKSFRNKFISHIQRLRNIRPNKQSKYMYTDVNIYKYTTVVRTRWKMWIGKSFRNTFDLSTGPSVRLVGVGGGGKIDVENLVVWVPTIKLGWGDIYIIHVYTNIHIYVILYVRVRVKLTNNWFPYLSAMVRPVLRVRPGTRWH